MSHWPVGVFTSINEGLGVHLEVAHELKIPTIQIHAPTKETRTAEQAKSFLNQLERMNIQLTAVFGGFVGESYADIPTVEKTVGLVPVETRSERIQEMKEISDFARQLNCNVVALHLGFVPHDTKHSSYADIVSVTRDLCRYCSDNGQNLHLETGQETADSLLQFIRDTGTDNLFVNFDPANMILYGTGEPIEALKKIGALVRSVHCKDAKWSDRPGETWGQEVPLGEGDVNIELYLQTLCDLKYDGPLTIEREIPQEPERQKQEVAHAADLLTGLRNKVGC